MEAHDEIRSRFEAAVVERLKESGFLEIEVRTECLARIDDGCDGHEPETAPTPAPREGSKDHADCMALVAAGFMTVRSGNELSGGDDVFRVTDAGKAAVAEHSPAPPKLTRSQQNYQDYLDYEGSLSFIEFLKLKAYCRALEAGRA